jgi:hypothetical protein
MNPCPDADLFRTISTFQTLQRPNGNNSSQDQSTLFCFVALCQGMAPCSLILKSSLRWNETAGFAQQLSYSHALEMQRRPAKKEEYQSAKDDEEPSRTVGTDIRKTVLRNYETIVQTPTANSRKRISVRSHSLVFLL